MSHSGGLRYETGGGGPHRLRAVCGCGWEATLPRTGVGAAADAWRDLTDHLIEKEDEMEELPVIDYPALKEAADTLRLAAKLLLDAGRRGDDRATELGFVAAKAEAAEESVFDFVSSADAYLSAPGSRDALAGWNVKKEKED